MSKHFYRSGSDRQRQAFRATDEHWNLSRAESRDFRLACALALVGAFIAGSALAL
jgi:hypothetical protein